MTEPIEVTPADVRSAWDAIYTITTPEGYSYTPPEPKPEEQYFDRVFLDGIKRALENDRKRVLERANA